MSGRPLRVPSHPVSRLAGVGRLTAGIAGRTILEGAKRLAKGEVPAASDLLLTPSNITRISDELSKMRGAALKLGQLISMDAGEFLPRELVDIMERLRSDADFMPEAQLQSVLEKNWGTGWEDAFDNFDMQPIAAASIGQVHKATSRDGRPLAVKVQYPGVRRSINSDIDNVVMLFRLSGLAPPQVHLKPLVEAAKKQLHEETEYLREAEIMRKYAQSVCKLEGFCTPEPVEDFTTDQVLTMTFVNGQSIENATQYGHDVADKIMEQMIRLFMEEVYTFGLIQSDPNFANYVYDKDTQTIGLLDFGATLAIKPQVAENYRSLLKAGMAEDRKGLRAAAIASGVYSEHIDKRYEARILVMVLTIFKELKQNQVFDFSTDQVLDKIREDGMELARDPNFHEIPPIEFIYLQRKVAGIYLLGRRLKARVPILKILDEYC